MKAHSRGTLKYLSYVALLLMMYPLSGGWKLCPKMTGHLSLVTVCQRTATLVEAVSFVCSKPTTLIDPGGDSMRGAPKCSCNKGNPCPGRARIILAWGRSLPRGDESPQKRPGQRSCFGNGSPSLSEMLPHGGFDSSGIGVFRSCCSDVLHTTVLLI